MNEKYGRQWTLLLSSAFLPLRQGIFSVYLWIKCRSALTLLYLETTDGKPNPCLGLINGRGEVCGAKWTCCAICKSLTLSYLNATLEWLWFSVATVWWFTITQITMILWNEMMNSSWNQLCKSQPKFTFCRETYNCQLYLNSGSQMKSFGFGWKVWNVIILDFVKWNAAHKMQHGLETGSQGCKFANMSLFVLPLGLWIMTVIRVKLKWM